MSYVTSPKVDPRTGSRGNPNSGSGSRPYAPSPNKGGTPNTPNRMTVRTLKTPPTTSGLTMLSNDSNLVTGSGGGGREGGPPKYGMQQYGGSSTNRRDSGGIIDESVEDVGAGMSKHDTIISQAEIADSPPPEGVVSRAHKHHQNHHQRRASTPASDSYESDDFESSSDEADTPEKGAAQFQSRSGPLLAAQVKATTSQTSSSTAPDPRDGKSPSPPPGEPATAIGRRGSRRNSVTNSQDRNNNTTSPPPTRATIHEPENSQPTESKPKKPPTLQVNMGQKQLIGKGSFGDVYRAVDMLTNRLVAVKEIVLVEDDTKDLKKQIHAVEREMRVMQKLDHPNIVKYLGAKRKGTTLYLYTEYVPGGTISDFVRQFGPCNELQCAKFMKQLLSGLDYLHTRHMIHRDLKGDNMFLEANGDLKLGDFGTSKELKTLRITNSVAGTPYFMAPEVINCSGHGLEADIWSVGCCLIQMLTGKPPFHECDNAFAIMFQVSKGEITSQIPEKCSDGAKDFIACCVKTQPKERWTTQQLLAHPWLVTTLNEPRPKSASKVESTAASPKAAEPTPVTSPKDDRPTSAVDRLRKQVRESTPPPTVSSTGGSGGGAPPKAPTSAGKSRSPPPPEVADYKGRGGGSGSGSKPGSRTSSLAKPSSSGSGKGVSTPLKRSPSTQKRPIGPK